MFHRFYWKRHVNAVRLHFNSIVIFTCKNLNISNVLNCVFVCRMVGGWKKGNECQQWKTRQQILKAHLSRNTFTSATFNDLMSFSLQTIMQINVIFSSCVYSMQSILTRRFCHVGRSVTRLLRHTTLVQQHISNAIRYALVSRKGKSLSCVLFYLSDMFLSPSSIKPWKFTSKKKRKKELKSWHQNLSVLDSISGSYSVIRFSRFRH